MTHEHCEHQSEGSSNWKQYALLAGLGIMLMLSVVQAMQINTLQGKLGGTASLASGTSQQQGETYEQMMARMHPDQVQQPASSSGGTTMVGGC